MKKVLDLAAELKRLFFGLVILSMVVSTFSVAIPRTAATGGPLVIYVDGTNVGSEDGTVDHPYNTIQEGINAASEGWTVNVAAGTYTESLAIDKALSLTGASSSSVTVTAASPTDSVFTVTASDVTISGFTATGTQMSGNQGYAGIKFGIGVTDCNIHDNILSNNQYGILLIESLGNTTLGGNTFTNNTASNCIVSGVEMQNTNGNTFTNNTANSNSSQGFRLANSKSNTFTGNTANSNGVLGNTNGGVGFFLVLAGGTGSNDNTFENNTASSNVNHGLRIDTATGNTLTGNTFSSNGADGIKLKTADNNTTVNNNTVLLNTIGVEIANANIDATTLTLGSNNISGNTTYNVSNSGTGTLDATGNWWGTIDPAAIEAAITGDVSYRPWYLTSDMTGLDSTPPGVNITSPVEGAKVSANTRINFDITGDYNLVICSIPNDALLSCESGISKMSNLAAFESVPEGDPFTLQVQASDASGNEGSASVINLVKDTNPPYLSSAAFGDGSSDPANIGTGGLLGFSETLSESDQMAVQSALQSATNTSLVFDWNAAGIYNVNLGVNAENPEDVIFSKAVWVLLKDDAGNAVWSRLVDIAGGDVNQIQGDAGSTSVTGDNQEYIFQPSTTNATFNVSFGSGGATLNLGALTTGGVASDLPEINITKTINDAGGQFDVNIPSGITITADDPSWNGVLNIPQVTTITTPGTFDSAIELGFPDTELTFDKAVKLTFEGKANKKIGYKRGAGAFHEITALCSDIHGYGLALDKQAFLDDHLDTGADCKINDDADLLVWTKHFTAFATFTSSSSSGGSYSPPSNAPSNPSISIAGGADGTNNVNVTLTLGATSATDMMISNNSDFSGASWETYATTKDWTLTAGDGTKTVYAKFKSSTGDVSSIVSDTITLNSLLISPLPPSQQNAQQQAAQPLSSNPADYDYEWIRQTPYPTIVRGQTATLWVEVKNTGKATWNSAVHFGSSHPLDRNCGFMTSNWLATNRTGSLDPAFTVGGQLPPGYNTRFTFTITAPSTLNPGTYREYFRPVVEGLTWMKDVGIYWDITVQ